jgi:hypothetical protein
MDEAADEVAAGLRQRVGGVAIDLLGHPGGPGRAAVDEVEDVVGGRRDGVDVGEPRLVLAHGAVQGLGVGDVVEADHRARDPLRARAAGTHEEPQLAELAVRVAQRDLGLGVPAPQSLLQGRGERRAQGRRKGLVRQRARGGRGDRQPALHGRVGVVDPAGRVDGRDAPGGVVGHAVEAGPVDRRLGGELGLELSHAGAQPRVLTPQIVG